MRAFDDSRRSTVWHARTAKICLRAGEPGLALGQAAFALVESARDDDPGAADGVMAALNIVFAQELYNQDAGDDLRARLFPG
jgi:hypothetical protein